MFDNELFRDVVVKDINDEVLKYCVEIPKTGIKYEMPTKFGFSLSVKIDFYKPGDYNYSVRTYQQINENLFTDDSFIRFTTTEGRQFLAKGGWIIPYLQLAGYTQGNYSFVFIPNSGYVFSDENISDAIFSVPSSDPFKLASKNR